MLVDIIRWLFSKMSSFVKISSHYIEVRILSSDSKWIDFWKKRKEGRREGKKEGRKQGKRKEGKKKENN